MSYLKPAQRERARALRRAETVSEQRLWHALRGRQLSGLKFVRQLPIGPYVADFAYREKRLIVEVNGATHSTDDEIAYDAARDAFLRREGWQVLRVWNEDALRRLDGVLETILLQCGRG
jgi:very-short-patch-repair endonuclease